MQTVAEELRRGERVRKNFQGGELRIHLRIAAPILLFPNIFQSQLRIPTPSLTNSLLPTKYSSPHRWKVLQNIN